MPIIMQVDRFEYFCTPEENCASGINILNNVLNNIINIQDIFLSNFF